ncbi:MAG: ferric reductase-like transmembrane domain-containing protein [Thermoanaerobaculia bacterium]
MRRTLTGVFWLVLYLLIVLGPLALVLQAPAPPPRPFWVELSIALGFVAFLQMGLQFVLVARFHKVTDPYGIDIIMQYHRRIALVGAVMLLLHPLILVVRSPRMLALLNPFGGTTASRWGVISVLALLVLIATSIVRKPLRLSYEWWRWIHIITSVVAVAAALVHILLVGVYTNSALKKGFFIVFAIAMIAVLLHLRIARPVLLRRRPWRVVEVQRERGRSWTLRAEPVGHAGMSFAPGQFVWMKPNSPFTFDEHPFSFSSSAESTDRVEFGIKELGDFTNRIGELAPGTPLFFDGPHGSFSIDIVPSAGYVFIAGGIGITPIYSMIRTMADRQDRRPVLLIYGSRTLENAPFRDELEALRTRVDLRIEYVLEHPEGDWPDERGFIRREVLKRLLPEEKIKRDIFVCGPLPMMEIVESALVDLGIPEARIHTERFDLV